MMENDNYIVWLTQADADHSDNPFLHACLQAGWQARGLPLIVTQRIANAEIVSALEKCLSSHLSGIIFTSPHSIEFLFQAITDHARLQQILLSLPCYCLSHRTTETAQRFGFTPAPQSGQSAEDLAQALCKSLVSGSLLFPCSLARKDTLPNILQEAGITVVELPIYGPLAPSTQELENFRNHWYAEPPCAVVFFSPSAVITAADMLKDLDWPKTQAIALGKTTARALEERGFRVAAIADEPTPEGLVRAIQILGTRHATAHP